MTFFNEEQYNLKQEFKLLDIYDAGGNGDCGPLSFRAGFKYIYFKNKYDSISNFEKHFTTLNIRKIVIEESIKNGNNFDNVEKQLKA